jgi:predicted deacylase
MNLISIRNEIKNRNKKIQGFTAIEEEGLLLPVTILCGKEAGKTILITGGIHNAEYVGIQAAIQLTELLKPDDITGNIIILPLVNRTGFEHRTMSCVYEDGKNINREFPGSKEGTLAKRICYFMEKELFSQIDYYIDLHCGDGYEELKSYVYCQGKASEEVCQISEKMARQVDVPYIVKSQSGTGGAYNYAGTMGIPGILLERGNLGIWSEREVEADIEDVTKILRMLGFFQDKGQRKNSEAYLITEAFYQNAEKTGCWYPKYRAGDIVEKDAILGEIKDYFGNILETHVAKEKSVILYQTGSLSVLEGETVIAYGKLTD